MKNLIYVMWNTVAMYYICVFLDLTRPDVDECRDGTNLCQFKETCRDYDGSYTCNCPSGYTRHADGFHCNGKSQNHIGLLYYSIQKWQTLHFVILFCILEVLIVVYSL